MSPQDTQTPTPNLSPLTSTNTPHINPISTPTSHLTIQPNSPLSSHLHHFPTSTNSHPNHSTPPSPHQPQPTTENTTHMQHHLPSHHTTLLQCPTIPIYTPNMHHEVVVYGHLSNTAPLTPLLDDREINPSTLGTSCLGTLCLAQRCQDSFQKQKTECDTSVLLNAQGGHTDAPIRKSPPCAVLQLKY